MQILTCISDTNVAATLQCFSEESQLQTSCMILMYYLLCVQDNICTHTHMHSSQLQYCVLNVN